MMNRRKKGLSRAMLALLIAGLIMVALSFVVAGVGFLCRIVAMCCFGGAFVVGLYWPTDRPRLAKALKAVKILTFTGLALLLVSFIAVQGLIISGWPQDPEPEVDYLIVLGAGLRGEQLSYTLHARVSLAADYLHKHPDCLAVVSGGQGPGEDIPEALAMQRFLIAQGIEPDRIWMEDRSTNTIENLSFSFDLLESRGVRDRRVAILSNSFHLYRACWIADRLGYQVESLGAPMPRLPFLAINSYVREYFSLVLLFFKAALGLV